jgi:MFS family permease
MTEAFVDTDRSEARSAGVPYTTCALLGLGGLFFGITGPLASTFVPPLVRDVLGENRSAIGATMAIDNVLLLVVLPLAGAASDRTRARGSGRLPVILASFALASIGMALIASSVVANLAGLLASMVVLYTGINTQRAPLHALVADLVLSRYRSLATGSVTFQMCVGAIVFLMLGRLLGRMPSFLIAAGTVLVIAAAFVLGIREPVGAVSRAVETTFRSIRDAASSAVRGAVPGMRAIFVASFLLQLTFQTFTTWYALHATERFRVAPEEITTGFIAWAVGGALGALPAGFVGARIGRRNAMLLGFALMGVSLYALDRVTTLDQAVPLLALASASWALPTVNSYPLFAEQVPPSHRGFLAALYLLSLALGGGIGDPLNGMLFDRESGYRALFLLMAVYSALAFASVLFVPRGAGEAGRGGDSPFL